MNLHLLRVFVTVVESGSFSRAAEKLAISQPAVSKAVRELESQIETTLLERQGRKIATSEVGKILFNYGKNIFAIEDKAEEAITAFHDLEKGHVTIGASTTVATYWLPPLIARFQSEHPNIEIRLLSGNTQEVVKLLIDCQIDVALVEGNTNDPRVEARPWLQENMVVIRGFSENWPNRLSDFIHIAERAYWVVREPGSGSREQTDLFLRRMGISEVKKIEVGSNEAVIQTVSSGIGLGLVPSICARDQIKLKKIVKLDVGDFSVRRQLFSIRLPHRMLSQAAIAFEALLSDYLHHDGHLT